MLLLALSDAHIPERAIDVPLKFKKLLNVPNKIQQVALLGNCTKSAAFLSFINKISENLVFVRGEFDSATIPTSNNTNEEVPLNTVISQGSFRIGCCNGYTLVPKNDPLSLLTVARQLDVDILLWGGTHNVEAYTLEGKFFINPGSCTGAFNTDWVQQEVEEVYKAAKSQDKRADVTSMEQPLKENTGRKDKQEPEDLEKLTEKDKNLAIPDNGAESDSDLDEFDDIDINGGGIPSFCLLDIQDITCTLYIYTYVDGELKVDKVTYKKDQ